MSTAKVDQLLPDATEDVARDERVENASKAPAPRRTITERLEAFISRLSTRNAFWQKVCSLIWLPYAFRSGIRMKRLGADRFAAVLPFRRFNRNWYNAMAGAALLGNSEVAAGMYLFAQCGSEYVVVCKELRYRFLRPCYGPAVYRVASSDNLADKLSAGGEFNIALDLEITQQLREKGKELRVGRCSITFHCTPKDHIRRREDRRRELEKAREAKLAATENAKA